MYDVICAGQAVLDCITRGREEKPYKPNVYRADAIRLHIGGDAVNESVALAGLGANVAVVCCLGRDIAGNIIADELGRAGVDTGRVRRAGIDTPIANLQVTRDGSRVSVNSPATRLEGVRIDPEAVKGARVVSLASLFRPPLEDFADVAALIRSAKAAGAILCADTKLPLREDVRLDGLADVLPLIDYMFPNEKEAAFYTGEAALPDMARALRARGVKNVIVKAGPEGCLALGEGEDEPFALPAVPVASVVDSTGAGDNFVAGFISGLLRRAPLRRCCELGLDQAAAAISHTGGTAGR